MVVWAAPDLGRARSGPGNASSGRIIAERPTQGLKERQPVWIVRAPFASCFGDRGGKWRIIGAEQSAHQLVQCLGFRVQGKRGSDGTDIVAQPAERVRTASP